MQTEHGFTIIETVVAVAILGLSLTVLIALETSYVDRYFDERMNTKAALYARYIMTIMEVSEEIPEPGTTNDFLRDKLEELGYFDYEPGVEVSDEEEFLGRNWEVETEVESIDIPLGTESFSDVLRRINVKITWSENKTYSLEFYKFNEEAVSTE